MLSKLATVAHDCCIQSAVKTNDEVTESLCKNTCSVV